MGTAGSNTPFYKERYVAAAASFARSYGPFLKTLETNRETPADQGPWLKDADSSDLPNLRGWLEVTPSCAFYQIRRIVAPAAEAARVLAEQTDPLQIPAEPATDAQAVPARAAAAPRLAATTRVARSHSGPSNKQEAIAVSSEGPRFFPSGKN